jgi:hypothetical protein
VSVQHTECPYRIQSVRTAYRVSVQHTKDRDSLYMLRNLFMEQARLRHAAPHRDAEHNKKANVTKRMGMKTIRLMDGEGCKREGQTATSV